MLSVVILNAAMLSVMAPVMPSVVMLNVIMLSVVAPVTPSVVLQNVSAPKLRRKSYIELDPSLLFVFFVPFDSRSSVPCFHFYILDLI